MQDINDYMAVHMVEMTMQDVLRVLELFEEHDIAIHVDGGWAVDALLGEQTRKHDDLDIAMQHKDDETLRELLVKHGYQEILRDDTRPSNYVLANDHGHMIDVHTYTFDEEGLSGSGL